MNIIRIYNNLGTIHQKILRFFSVIYQPISRTTFLELLQRSEFLDSNGNKLTSKSLKPYLDNLVELNLLEKNNNNLLKCHSNLIEIATREAVKLGEFKHYVQVIERVLPVAVEYSGDRRKFAHQDEFIREVRIGIYQQDLAYIYKQYADYQKYKILSKHISLDYIFFQVLYGDFDAEWFNELPAQFYEEAIASLLSRAFLKILPAAEILTLLENNLQNKTFISNQLICILTEQLLLRGKVTAAEKILDLLSEDYGRESAYRGWINYLQGECQSALDFFNISIKSLQKETGKRKILLDKFLGLFYVLTLLQEGSEKSLELAQEYTSLIAKKREHFLSKTYENIEKFLKIQQGDLSDKESLKNDYIAPYKEHHCLETLIHGLCLYWIDIKEARSKLPAILKPIYEEASAAGYDWLALEAVQLLARLQPRSSYNQLAKTLSETLQIQSIVDIIKPQEAWEIALNALLKLQKDPEKEVPKTTAKRLAWFLEIHGQNYNLQPREQVMNAQGNWSKGRNIALRRLHKDIKLIDYITPQDALVCSHIEYEYGYYGSGEYSFGVEAITALVGHPLVFLENSPNIPIEIVQAAPEFSVNKQESGDLLLTLNPSPSQDSHIYLQQDSPTHLKVIVLDQKYKQIAEIIGQNNYLQIPEQGQEKVLAAIKTVSRLVTVHSDIGGEIEGVTETVSSSQPHLHLLPVGEGLKAVILVQPFAEAGPYYRPGKGGETIITEIAGKRVQTKRQLEGEKALALQVIEACPTLSRLEDGTGEWIIEEVEDCLELLLELQEIQEQVIIAWPEGEKYRITDKVGMGQFSLSIRSEQDWFAATGELTVNEEQVLDMKQLFALLRDSPGRFLPLGNGQFLALTKEFRRRLEEIRSLTEKTSQGFRFHPLATPALEEIFSQGMKINADVSWKNQVRRFQEVENLPIEIPSTLQAELRDYQVEGFRWMARLAHWGAGACLADDMGLGKTLQALALILTRAAQGPTLVVAPTSVCLNWFSEAERFTPTLRVIQFGNSDRRQLLQQLQPFDLFICSYGLLQQPEVAQMLAEISWETIILDEAQAIKNFTTKRSQSAMSLQGKFKLITTGTPIENHLGELWNLFRFINPGLLGSLESFNRRFAHPIEKYNDKQTRQHLKKLIQPFLLRRTKNQVLQELPPRTEITLQVELSTEETAFYEALRRDAVDKLTDSEAEGGAKHLQILVEIMRLRRACCHPRLIMPAAEIKSSKLEVLRETLQEILENNHKALVFSQFVDHLSIVREVLEQEKISYQYLDGSTPAVERKKRVDAFQGGTGDVFLISLKAGGTGLNLTAADYVIHLDPWWNPAVEDQASDRAHRLGQKRPVTIYRLVAKGTIEEKILQLHGQKRDLADSLLSGSDLSGKLSTEELLQLISQ
jgi:superfamily II DNA or RNA helicase